MYHILIYLLTCNLMCCNYNARDLSTSGKKSNLILHFENICDIHFMNFLIMNNKSSFQCKWIDINQCKSFFMLRDFDRNIVEFLCKKWRHPGNKIPLTEWLFNKILLIEMFLNKNFQSLPVSPSNICSLF